ncbi:MAG: hypothetical protein ACM3XM_13655 [Mycobacterium leprae]
MFDNKVTLTIPGLLPDAAGSLLSALRAMDGVSTVNLLSEKVSVQYDPETTGIGDLKATVAAHGYAVSSFAVEEEEETCFSGG